MGVLHIGVTGHRILAENHNLEGGVQQVIHRIDEQYPNHEWTVYSSLAEGADCLFVRFALQRPGVKLVVPLPLPVPQYTADFSSAESLQIFQELYERASQVVHIPPERTHEAAFWAAGEYILNHCDLIVAIWDGKSAQGEGGTGQVVAEARRRNKPLAWIRAGNRRTGTLVPTHLGEKQGIVIFERFEQR